jgi:hypothetical protein
MTDTPISNTNGQEEPQLTIGDRTYPIAGLSEEAQKLVMAVRDCEEQITQLKRRLNYLEIARRTLIQELSGRLPD